MLSKADQRKLHYMSCKIVECEKCPRLRPNGLAIPFWTPKSWIMGLAEAPGREEVQHDPPTPLVGSAGRKLFEELNRIGLERSDFMLVNSCQCRPVEDGRNGKPTDDEIENCRPWFDLYFSILKPDYLFAFGSYALFHLYKMRLGVKELCGQILNYKGTKVFPILHPASLLYDPGNIKLFRKSLDRFRKEI